MTVRVQDGPDVKFNYRIVTTPTASPLPPITPRSVLPQVGVLTAYAAPRPLVPLALGFPVFDPSARSAKVDLTLTRGSGVRIHDDGFIGAVGVSEANALGAYRLCAMLLFVDRTHPTLDPLREFDPDEFGQCAHVVARVLQRAENLRTKQGELHSARATQAGRCRSVAVRLRGSRGRSPLAVTCVRTPTGMRITIRSRLRNRSLRSAAGRAPKLIVGRSRLAAARAGDRVNVLWQTSPRR